MNILSTIRAFTLSLIFHLILLIILLLGIYHNNKQTVLADLTNEVSFVFEQEDIIPPAVEKKTVLPRKQVMSEPSKIHLPTAESKKTESKQSQKETVPIVNPEGNLTPAKKDLSLLQNESQKTTNVPKPVIGGTEGVQVMNVNPSGNVVLFGPIFNRNILYSEVPEYPEWARAKGIETEVKMRIWVNPDGMVSDVFVLKKSGYVSLDLLVDKALKRWKFTPMAENVPQVKQWGEILIKFVLY